jgi:hypothetical protein
MKSTLLASLCCMLMLAGVGLSDGNKKGPKAPGLTYLYTVNITGGEFYNTGPGPRGTRLIVPILKGNFAGPKLKGRFVPEPCRVPWAPRSP